MFIYSGSLTIIRLYAHTHTCIYIYIYIYTLLNSKYEISLERNAETFTEPTFLLHNHTSKSLYITLRIFNIVPSVHEYLILSSVCIAVFLHSNDLRPIEIISQYLIDNCIDHRYQKVKFQSRVSNFPSSMILNQSLIANVEALIEELPAMINTQLYGIIFPFKMKWRHHMRFRSIDQQGIYATASGTVPHLDQRTWRLDCTNLILNCIFRYDSTFR